MAVVIDPTKMYFGAPTTLTFNGVDVGATIDFPKIIITPTVYSPRFQNAKAFIAGADIVTFVEASVEVTVNELSLAKILWGLPGATKTGNVITWTPGRIQTTEYHEVVLITPGLGGQQFIFALFNAIHDGPIELDWNNTAMTGQKLKFIGRALGASPLVAPFQIDINEGS